MYLEVSRFGDWKAKVQTDDIWWAGPSIYRRENASGGQNFVGKQEEIPRSQQRQAGFRGKYYELQDLVGNLVGTPCRLFYLEKAKLFPQQNY